MIPGSSLVGSFLGKIATYHTRFKEIVKSFVMIPAKPALENLIQ
jgi:hypothetical protein